MAEENPKTTNANGAEIVGGNRKESNMEPSENDPCMGDNTKPKSRFQFLINHRDSVCKKTGLTHNGFHVMCGVCVLCFVLFIIVVALGAAWPHIPHRYQFPVCKEAACLRTAAQVNFPIQVLKLDNQLSMDLLSKLYRVDDDFLTFLSN